MPYYRKKRTPAELAALKERREQARVKIINELRNYARQWKDPALKPMMEERAACGRESIKERTMIRTQALQRFLQKQPESMTRLQWLMTLSRNEQTISSIIYQMSGGIAISLRAKTAEHLFRTMSRDRMLKLNSQTGLWENQCRTI